MSKLRPKSSSQKHVTKNCNYCAERLCCSCTLIQILLIRVLVIKHLNRRFGCETIHPTKKYFNEFVANALRDNMVMIIFDLQGCEGCQRSKTSYLDVHFGTLTQCLVHPSVPVLLISGNSRTKPTRLNFQSFRKLISQSGQYTMATKESNTTLSFFLSFFLWYFFLRIYKLH